MSESSYEKGDDPEKSPKPKNESDKWAEIHKQALERFRQVCDAEHDQRKNELDALEFKALKQWPDDIVSARQGTVDGQGKTVAPARPMLTIPVLDQPISQVVNQGRAASLAIKITPRKDADVDDARMFEGLIRNIEYESHAQSAYVWAFERAVIAGRGFFRITNEYDEEDEHGDQVIRIRRILNQASVYLDPWAQEADWSDGRWAFVTEDVPVDVYKRRYPRTKLAKMSKGNAGDETFVGLGNDLKYWCLGTDELPSYRIAEYWYVEDEPDGSQRKVCCGKMNGVEWLEPPQDTNGPDIPIIPVLGVEYNVNGKRMFNGIVRPAMDACRMINYMASSLAEQAGLATKAPYLAIAGQLQGFEAAWSQANTRNFMALEYNAVTASTGGQILPPPSRDVANPPIDHMTTSIAVFTNFVRSTTGVPDAALGHINPNDRSGKAIEALKTAAETGNSNWLDNLSRAIRRGGQIIVRQAPQVYDRPGRIVQIIGPDESQKPAMVGQPFVLQGGQPRPVDANTRDLQPGQQIEEFNLEKGRYNVAVDVGKSSTTLRAEGSAAMAALAQAAPQLLPVYADVWIGSMDFPGAQKIAKRLEQQNPLADKNGQPPIPPQVQQQMQMQGKLVEELSAHVQQLTQTIQTKQIEQQFKLEESKMDNATKLQIAKIQAAVQLAAVDAKISAENARTFVEDAEERLAHQVDMIEARLGRGHDHAMQAHQHAHEQQVAATEHEQALQQAQQAHEHLMLQGQQAHESALQQGEQSGDQAMQQQEAAQAAEPSDSGSE